MALGIVELLMVICSYTSGPILLGFCHLLYDFCKLSSLLLVFVFTSWCAIDIPKGPQLMKYLNSSAWTLRHIFWLFSPLRAPDWFKLPVPHTTMISVTLPLKEIFQMNRSNGGRWSICLLCDFKWVGYQNKMQRSKQMDIFCNNESRWATVEILSF